MTTTIYTPLKLSLAKILIPPGGIRIPNQTKFNLIVEMKTRLTHLPRLIYVFSRSDTIKIVILVHVIRRILGKIRKGCRSQTMQPAGIRICRGEGCVDATGWFLERRGRRDPSRIQQDSSRIPIHIIILPLNCPPRNRQDE